MSKVCIDEPELTETLGSLNRILSCSFTCILLFSYGSAKFFHAMSKPSWVKGTWLIISLVSPAAFWVRWNSFWTLVNFAFLMYMAKTKSQNVGHLSYPPWNISVSHDGNLETDVKSIAPPPSSVADNRWFSSWASRSEIACLSQFN